MKLWISSWSDPGKDGDSSGPPYGIARAQKYDVKSEFILEADWNADEGRISPEISHDFAPKSRIKWLSHRY